MRITNVVMGMLLIVTIVALVFAFSYAPTFSACEDNAKSLAWRAHDDSVRADVLRRLGSSVEADSGLALFPQITVTVNPLIGYIQGDSLIIHWDSAGTPHPPDPLIPIIDTTIDTVGYEQVPNYELGWWTFGLDSAENLRVNYCWKPILHYHLDTIGYRLTAEQLRRLR